MRIVKGKGGRDYSKELGRNAGPGRDEIRANTLWGLVAGAQGHGQGFRAAYACGGGHTPARTGLWKIKEAKGGGVSHEESQGESLGSLVTTTMILCLQEGQRLRSMPVSSSISS